jgi:hypothetical protein
MTGLATQPAAPGTVITGSFRSGTTLALRLLCPDLTPEEERDGSAFNEPQPFVYHIFRREPDKAVQDFPTVIANRHRLIKAPQMGLCLDAFEPDFEVITVFRDLRTLVPSIVRHDNAAHFNLCDDPFWAHYAGVSLPDHPVERALLSALCHYRLIARYEGAMRVWNYGFWDDWEVRNTNIASLYDRPGETSPQVLEDVRNGRLFSRGSFHPGIWNDFCSEYGLDRRQRRLFDEAAEELAALYAARGLTLKTLDDPVHP